MKIENPQLNFVKNNLKMVQAETMVFFCLNHQKSDTIFRITKKLQNLFDFRLKSTILISNS